jgi:hypothetical protein
MPIFASFGDRPIPPFRVVFVTSPANHMDLSLESTTAAFARTVAAGNLVLVQRKSTQ